MGRKAGPKNLTPEARRARDVLIWDLRTQGWTQAQIAVETDLSPQTVAEILAKQRTAFAAAHQENVEHVFSEELAAVEEQIKVWTERALSGDRGAFRAGELVLRFRERKARLLGLDRPAKLEVSGSIVTPVDVELAELMAALGQNDPTVAPAEVPADAPSGLSEVDF